MPFVALFNRNGTPPGRFYLHDHGLEAFGDNPIENAKEYTRKTLKSFEPEKFYYLLGVLHGRKTRTLNERIIELYGYSNTILKEWRGNPDVDLLNVVNGRRNRGFYRPCGDTLILLGREEEHRRKSRSLSEYFGLGVTFPRGLLARQVFYEGL